MTTSTVPALGPVAARLIFPIAPVLSIDVVDHTTSVVRVIAWWPGEDNTWFKIVRIDDAWLVCTHHDDFHPDADIWLEVASARTAADALNVVEKLMSVGRTLS